jgi:anti-sigma B factor antagonist
MNVRIDESRSEGTVTLRLAGRVDREWADHLSRTLAVLLQAGARSLVLDFAEVTYVSSAATAVLGRWQEELSLLRGRLQLQSVTPEVREMFESTGWTAFDVVAGRSSGPLRVRQSAWYARSGWQTTAQYQATVLDEGASLTCRVHQGETVALPLNTLGLGVGAIGRNAEACADRFGELLAVAGAVAYFPSDGARLPDYMVAGPGAVAHAVLGQGLSCAGSLAQLVRFAEAAEADPVPLSDLAATCLDVAGTDTAGVVVAAETRGLCGARLRRSPALAPVQFAVPQVRDWLAFAPEPGRSVSTALLVGVVARAPVQPLAAMLRPLRDELHGHFHAAVFSYTPLPQRTVDLAELVRGLFAEQELRDVLHLLRDDRSAEAIPESTLVRGVAWVSPISQVT